MLILTTTILLTALGLFFILNNFTTSAFRKSEYALMAILMIFGIALSLYYGRIGYMPLDQSIIFDGGWRILSGQVPFRDFTSPTGFTPMLIQALFFKGFGVSWFCYCLHAALFNGLFCLVGYGFLRRLKAPAWLAFFYALLSAVVLYPPFGVPYMEQHAFFFTMLALLMTLVALQTPSQPARTCLWLTLPFVMLLAYLSKQIPTVFAVPVILWMMITWGRAQLRSNLIGLALGTALSLLIVVAVIAAFHINLEMLRYYYFDLPAGAGPLRLLMALENQPALIRWNLASAYFIQLLFFSFILIAAGHSFPRLSGFTRLLSPLLLLGILMALVGWLGLVLFPGLLTGLPHSLQHYSAGQVTSAWANLGFAMFGCFWLLKWLAPSLKTLTPPLTLQAFPQGDLLILAEALLLICFLFSSLARNQAANGIPYIFIGLGLIHLFLLNLGARLQISHVPLGSRSLRLPLVIGGLLMSMAVVDAFNFNAAVNATRMVNDFHSGSITPEAQSNLPEAMRFSQWALPASYTYTAKDLTSVTRFMSTHPGNFLLIGDTSILYGITHRPSINPGLFYHYGLAIPWKKSAAFTAYEQTLIGNMKQHAVRFIVLEGKHTQMGIRLSAFQRLDRLVTKHTCQRDPMGGFQVITLCPGWENASD